MSLSKLGLDATRLCALVYRQLQFIYLSHPNVSHWMSLSKPGLDGTRLCAVVYGQTHMQMRATRLQATVQIDVCINMTRRKTSTST